MGRDELLELIERAAVEGWTELDLAGLGLREIPAEIGKLVQLETLILGKFEDWEWIENEYVPKLITNELTALPPEIAGLKNLKKLDLSGNLFRCIPKAVFELCQLDNLALVNVDLSEIPETITNLINLTHLDFSFNQITQIPEAIGNLTSLTHLDFSFNQITQIPEVIGNLTSLIKLHLSHNQIIQIPETIGNLSHLIWLDLSHNQITGIPVMIGNLSNLTELYLHANEITEIPADIGKLSHLTRLFLWGNQVIEIPVAIGKLSRLTALILSSNQITKIPVEISNLSRLSLFYLHSNQITEIPAAISNLSRLTRLDLSVNQIAEIPTVISKLTSLTYLKLSKNQITKIPEAIGNLSNLTTLYLSNNQISHIPENLSNLSNLAELHLRNNQISHIPEWLESLPNLEKLDLCRNPLPISPEILGSYQEPGSVADIFNYLRLLHSGKVRPLNEAKLLLIGQGSVGKTSLIERLLHQRYNPNQPQTDGLKVEPWQIHVNSKDVRLNVWDFGGQEIYHATHQFFLTKRSLYLLVCNCRTSEEENRIEYWLKLIASFGGESPVIIVGNKKDEQPFDINRKALREKYPNIQAIIETSCQDNLGIDELRTAILSEVAGLKEVYDLLPLPWFEVKEQLESMTQDFISYNQYLNICIQKQIPEEQNQEQLIDLLHRLGLVLNFREHPILQNTNVLKPDWVTAGIYTLLSDETLKTTNKGIFTPADLSRILDPQRYPEQRHQYLIELMKEFELCFALDCHPPRFLIPGLLPKDEPQNTDLEGETLEFQYHYRVLPQSIISRFIVLTHEKIHNQTYWRSGVMLEDKEGQDSNIARIKADPEDKKIFITISGRSQTRRSFLKAIRDVFKKIHSTFTNPEITEWVPVPNHPDHPPLDYQELLGLEEMKETTVPIGKLKLKIDLRQLLDGYEDINSRQRSRRGDRFDEDDKYEDMREIAKLAVSRPIINKAEANAVSKESNYTNHLQGANIANLVNEVNDEATVTATDFTQNSTTTSTELTQIINNLRQAAAQFPPEIQEGIIIDIDDVETEIKKPENKRNLPRLKKCLAALLAAATFTGGAIAGGIDFANNVVDLGSKVGIELKLPHAP